MANQANKKPKAYRFGKRATKLTLGAAYLLGRTTARTARGIAAGVTDAAKEVRSAKS